VKIYISKTTRPINFKFWTIVYHVNWRKCAQNQLDIYPSTHATHIPPYADIIRGAMFGMSYLDNTTRHRVETLQSVLHLYFVHFAAKITFFGLPVQKLFFRKNRKKVKIW
jgi:hypothetical protein